MSTPAYTLFEACDVCTAAGLGDLPFLKELVGANKALVNAADYDQRSVLHVAVAEQQVDVVEFLLRSGADVNAQDQWGATPLQDAMHVHNDYIIKMLEKAGGKVLQDKEELFDLLSAACEIGDSPMIKRYIENGADPAGADYDQRTPLHVAAAGGHLQAVELLVQKQAPVNVVDRWGRTPLSEAIRNGHDSVMEYLVSHGGQFTNKDELAIGLATAAADGQLDVARRLLAAGVDASAGDYDKRTPLHVAASNGHLEMVQLLVEKGANIDAEDLWGGTPLSEADGHGRDDVVAFLRSKNAKYGKVTTVSSSVKFDGTGSESSETVEELKAMGIATVLEKIEAQHNAAKFVGRALQAIAQLVATPRLRDDCLAANGHGTVVAIMAEHSFDSDVQEHGCNILRELASTDNSAPKVVAAGAMRACIDALRDGRNQTIQYACNALSNMTFPEAVRAGENCEVFVKEGGVKEVVHCVRQYGTSSETLLLSKAVAALWNVSDHDTNWERVVAEGGVQPVVAAWKHHAGEASVVESCSGLLVSLARTPTVCYELLESMRVAEASVEALIQFESEGPICVSASGLLARLAPVQAKKSVMKVLQRKNGIKALCNAMLANEDEVALIENAASVFISVTARSEKPEGLVHQFKKYKGKKAFVEAYQRFPESEVLAKAMKQLEHLESGCCIC